MSFIKCLLNAFYAQGPLGSAGIKLSPCYYFTVEMMNMSCKQCFEIEEMISDQGS